MSSLPSNIHVSSHPCLKAKLSQLRSQSTSTPETRELVNEIATILAIEAFAVCLKSSKLGTVGDITTSIRSSLSRPG